MSSWTDDLTRRGANLREPPWNCQTRYSKAWATRRILKALTSNAVLLGMKYYQVARALFMSNKGKEWVMNPAVRISVWCEFERQITEEETLKYESCKDLVSTGLENQLLLPMVIKHGRSHARCRLQRAKTKNIIINRLTPNDPYVGRIAPLTSKRYILYIYSTNIGTEYFKHALHSAFFFFFKMQFVS